MSKNKMTAVEWLATEILKLEGIQDVAIPDNLFHIAIQKEREQIEEAFIVGIKGLDESNEKRQASDYYTQTYEECTQQ